MRLLIQRLGWLIGFFVPFWAEAFHYVGGQLEMRAVGDRPGHFRIIVTNYMESGRRADEQHGGQLGIFRLRDNSQMTTFTATETGRQPLTFTNETCAQQRNLNFLVVVYEADIQLDPAQYTDPRGYYMSFQTRNRNAGIDNLTSPSQTGFTFYLEFPPLTVTGTYINNSSPRFPAVNGEYVCAGQPFTFPFGATDPDGDELRYSLVTPLNQRTNSPSPGPYPDINWAGNFSAANAIPGNPPLRVDARTGQLSVTASQLGLYVFAIKVEEYRGGVKIGEVRRDFQLLVVDCPNATKPAPIVQVANRPDLAQVTICPGDSVVLQATINPNWNYQWQRDAVNLTDATTPTLTVRDGGLYTVQVSPKNQCGQSGGSSPINVYQVGQETVIRVAGHLCETSGSVSLTILGAQGVTYQWYADGQPLAGKTTDSLRVDKPGHYWNVLTHTALGCKAYTDTVPVTRLPPVQATLRSATGQPRICPGDSLRLDAGGGLSYVWQRDGQLLTTGTSTTFYARRAGSYSLTATDAYGCVGASPPLTLSVLPPVTVRFDSLAPVCGPVDVKLPLVVSPPGGEFAGPGLTEDQFSPQLAGVGNHALTYTVRAAPECTGTSATQTAVVSPTPTIDLPPKITTYTGNTFTLAPALTGNPNRFAWSPGLYLTNTNQAAVQITNIQSDVVYVMRVENASGCAASDTVQIVVFDQILVPDAFSPNGDGMNDTWELKGIEAFPEAEITVFNRWGSVIFWSKGYARPFDGTWQGEALAGGVYAYTLRSIPNGPTRRGSLTIVKPQ